MSGVEVDPIMSPIEGLILFDGTNPSSASAMARGIWLVISKRSKKLK
jgi:hypothetical protein